MLNPLFEKVLVIRVASSSECYCAAAELSGTSVYEYWDKSVRFGEFVNHLVDFVARLRESRVACEVR
jgi:hypothetical protein